MAPLPDNWEQVQEDARRQGKGVVYLLELEDGKYYVGWTQNFAKRMHDHFNGMGSKWTQEHAPLRILMIRTGTLETENIITDRCRKHWGRENVRGGIYMSPIYF